jgi:hypothetical protein
LKVIIVSSKDLSKRGPQRVAWQTAREMELRVDRACGQVIGNPVDFPLDVREAAFRLQEFFGNRRFGSIGRDDFRAYVRKSADCDPGTDTRRIGSPAEIARFDLLILGTLSGFAGEIALWELIQTWSEEDRAPKAKRPSRPRPRPHR